MVLCFRGLAMKILQILRNNEIRSRASCFLKVNSCKTAASNSINTFVSSSVVPSRESRCFFAAQVVSPRYLHLSAVKDNKQNNTSTEREVCVYIGPLRQKLKFVKIFSLITSGAGLCFFPFVLYEFFQVNVFACIASGVISSVFLATPFFLHFVGKRYVVELTFNPESRIFTAKTLSLFAHVKELKFAAEDVYEPDVPGFLSSFQAKGIPLFVDAQLVEDPDAYSHMMGYDKPLDLLIHTEEKENLTGKNSDKNKQQTN